MTNLAPTLTLAATGLGAGSVRFDVGAAGGIAGNVAVYTTAFLGISDRQFTSRGQRLGAGALTVTLDEGPHAAVAIADDGQISPVLRFRIGPDDESPHYRCLVAAREFLLQLALPGMEANPDNHRIVKLPYRPGTEFNVGEGVFYFPKAESFTPEDNVRDGVTFPVQVVWIRKSTKSLEENLTTLLQQRNLMFRSFSGASFIQACEVHTVRIRPGAVALPDHWKDSFDTSSVVFEMQSQITSGVS